MHERREREGDRVPSAGCARSLFDALDQRGLECLPGACRVDDRPSGGVPAHRAPGDADHRASGLEVVRAILCNLHVSIERRAELVEAGLQHTAHAEAQGTGPAGRGVLVPTFNAVDRLAERVGEGAEAPRLLGEAEDLLDGRIRSFAGARSGIEEQRAAHERKRGLAVQRARLGDARSLHQDGDLRADLLRGVQAMLGEVEHEAPVVGGVVGGEQHADDVGAVLGALQERTQADA